MKTYAESKGYEPFDWNKALNRKSISEKQWIEMEARAERWTTCACGNQCNAIPRYFDGIPRDEVLATLGGSDAFLGAIYDRDAKQAKIWLSLIEFRAAQILQEINDKRKK